MEPAAVGGVSLARADGLAETRHAVIVVSHVTLPH
jgi:hypothetical protein